MISVTMINSSYFFKRAIYLNSDIDMHISSKSSVPSRGSEPFFYPNQYYLVVGIGVRRWLILHPVSKK